MNADKAIEWITHVMGIELTAEQERTLRENFEDDGQMLRPRWVSGNKAGEAIMDEAARNPKHIFMGTYREVKPSELMGQELALTDLAALEVAARIPDRVFMDSDDQNAMEHKYGLDFLATAMGKATDEWSTQLAAKVSKAKSNLELLHGHGPAEVEWEWETDFREHATKGTVTMPYKEGCVVCGVQSTIKKLREDNDG